MFICKPFAVLLSISSHTGTHPLSPTHALPQLPAQSPANNIFFSYVQKGLRVVNFIIWMCATKMELREIKRSLSKQERCRVTKVGLKRLVYFCKHAWERFCSKKSQPCQMFEGIFSHPPSSESSWADQERNSLTFTYTQLCIWYDVVFFF